MTRPVVARAALAGAASGGRAMTALGLLTATAAPSKAPSWLRILAVAAAGGELVADKLPQAPSRLEPPGLLARLATAAACAVILDGRDRAGQPVDRSRLALCIGAATTSAAATSWLGARWRRAAAAPFGTDLAPALIEDAAVVALAYFALE